MEAAWEATGVQSWKESEAHVCGFGWIVLVQKPGLLCPVPCYHSLVELEFGFPMLALVPFSLVFLQHLGSYLAFWSFLL